MLIVSSADFSMTAEYQGEFTNIFFWFLSVQSLINILYLLIGHGGLLEIILMNSFRKILPLNKFICKIEELYKSMYCSSENRRII